MTWGHVLKTPPGVSSQPISYLFFACSVLRVDFLRTTGGGSGITVLGWSLCPLCLYLLLSETA